MLSDAKEVDSDVNEDAGREKLLDASLERFVHNVKVQVRRKGDMTNVPDDSVFAAAETAGQPDRDAGT
ncbi:hypothetical protein SD70_26850 [Gordoniibacillus kamchatkensis]|uniref:Uncharacterized protein n=1 Tax=Gordoniibacillus kamchatkensis TaxID=1590651 RepID=A0ABR5ACQ0_9BACL|nr:hypothetical protein SD70_26850 [Paenibacillus sp. VKM B-2647]